MNDLTSTLIGLVEWFDGERYRVTPIGQQAARRLLKIVAEANRAFGSWHARVTRLAVPDLALGDLEDAKLFEVDPAFRTIAAKVYALGGPHPGPEPAAIEPGEIDEAKMLRSLTVPGALRDFTLTLEAYRQQLEELL